MDLKNTLADLKERDLFRTLSELPNIGGKFIWQDKPFLNFSSNDYLNLATSDKLKKAAIGSIENFGTGATGSRLMSGHLSIHTELERKLAKLMQTQSALIMGSGFLTNLGVISAVAGSGDCIIFDELNHASLIDGVRASGAKWKRYKHCDTNSLKNKLKAQAGNCKNCFVITDSLFSMDGDIAPLKEIATLTEEFGAHLIVDEAHALGVMGKSGAGLCSEYNIKPTLITATFSKAYGGYGGFVAGSAEIINLLINRARSFIFSTALPPACVASAMAAMENIQNNGALGKNLLKNAKYFHTLLSEGGLNLLPFASPIIPIIIGSNIGALALADELMKEGLLTKAIRPPTVPEGTARLRLSVTLAHTPEDLQHAAERIINAAQIGGQL